MRHRIFYPLRHNLSERLVKGSKLKKITKWEKGTREDLDDELLIAEYEGQKYYVDPDDDEDIIQKEFLLQDPDGYLLRFTD